MQNFDDLMKENFNKLVEDGTVENIFKEQLIAGIKKGIEESFRYGDLSRAIDKRVKEIMIPHIEGYDFNEYLPKLDTVLTEIVNSTSLVDNRKILQNFKTLMTEPSAKEINLSGLFNVYNKQTAEQFSCTGREVSDDYDDDGPTYEPFETTFEFNEDENREWLSFGYATIDFTTDDDEQQELNRTVRLSKWKKDNKWHISCCDDLSSNLGSLRNLGEFDVLILTLARANTTIIIDETSGSEEVEPEERPEASWS